LLELKGNSGADLFTSSMAAAAGDHSADILNALLALGYSDKEAMLAMKSVPKESGVSEGIKLALKSLSKG
jgi:Holliday junction DNA helicase RuvA